MFSYFQEASVTLDALRRDVMLRVIKTLAGISEVGCLCVVYRERYKLCATI